MKHEFLEILVCPLCKGKLVCESLVRGAGGELEDGIIACEQCSERYPVIMGIPRMLPPSLRSMVVDMHGWFFDSYGAKLPGWGSEGSARRESKDIEFQKATAKSFGFEWQAFSEMLPEYEDNFRWYFERFQPAEFRDILVLDAGCGTGRHTYHMAQTGVRAVCAMDLSQAIEVAARNNAVNRNTHFVQGDIYNPPFREQQFDLVYSLGVLHHLPEPQKGFRSLLPLLKESGSINIYLYWNLESEPRWRRGALSVVTAIRRVTTKMPHPLLKKLSWLIAAGLYVSLVVPAKILDKFDATRDLANRIPLGHYHRYPFRVVYTDQFDRFSAPIENRYGRAEVFEWLKDANLEEIVILGGAGWRASGRKAAANHPDIAPHLTGQIATGQERLTVHHRR
jgi:SAM-dependent methyltransferase/uncharacterized protein YbaR (Trm112 family)